jgi:hypothetical protein
MIFLFLFIIIFRLTHVSSKEISWDVLGYYLYLPSTFIHHDPLLNDISWLKELNDKEQLTGTFYQISSNLKGEPMYFFLMGMSLFYLPFFFLAIAISSLLNISADGFGLIFQYSLVAGGLFYTLTGLYFFRKILLKYFSEKITAFVLFIIVIGTNYIHHLTLDNLATVNVLFMLTAILCWNTIRWHEEFKPLNLVIAGICPVLMGLIKPSEIIIILLPLLWGVDSWESLKTKFKILSSNWKSLVICLCLALLIVFPQIYYWYLKTGKIIYDSYKNPGVGLDLFSPHTVDALFSYRKGWLLYTPVMFFSLSGFYYLYQEKRNIFFAIFTYFILSFYIITSWSEWWYGAAYSLRPMITMYPLLGVTLGYFLTAAQNYRQSIKVFLFSLIIVLIAINQFQWWQFRSYLIDPYRTTKESYWSVFLKTNPDPSFKNKLLVERDFTGGFNFNNKENYIKNTMGFMTFDEDNSEQILTDSSGRYYRMKSDQEYSKTFEYKFRQLTNKDHAWLEASLDIRFAENFKEPYPLLVMSMEHKGKIYGYHSFEIKPDSVYSRWSNIKSMYLTPEIRDIDNVFKAYIWKRGTQQFDIDNFRLDVFEHK